MSHQSSLSESYGSTPQVPPPSRQLTTLPVTDLPWPRLPTRDPFSDLSCDHDDSSSSPEGTITLSFPREPALIPDPDTPPSDTYYFHFFLTEMSNVLPYINLFPSTSSALVSGSFHHPALRHSILSISALIADTKAQKGPEKALEHLAKSLKFLQTHLSSVDLDEGVAISIFLLSYFNVSSGQHSTARKHLSGLCMVLQQLQQKHMVRNGGVLSPYAISPLTMLIWRMAIRMDFIMSLLYGLRPILPVYAPPWPH